ncbi:hypothetical protein HYW75_00535 [Candidatus Pacearchaeota archaeon]|nr:hypothetical protein [Candidatus Pacearchaeota archaeon]
MENHDLPQRVDLYSPLTGVFRNKPLLVIDGTSVLKLTREEEILFASGAQRVETPRGGIYELKRDYAAKIVLPLPRDRTVRKKRFSWASYKKSYL